MSEIGFTAATMPLTEPEDSYAISARRMECHFCQTEFAIERVERGEGIKCPECGQTLIRIDKFPFLTPIVYGSLALFAFFLSLTFPLITIDLNIVHQETATSVLTMFSTMMDHGHVFFAFVFFFFVIITPPIFICATLYVYCGLYFKKLWPGIHAAAYIMGDLRPWIMADIFFISIIVSLVKIHDLAQIELGYTVVTLLGYCVFLARIVLSISEYWVMEKMLNLEGRTIVPGRLSDQEVRRRADSKLKLARALLLTALILYFPANLLPMMITEGVYFNGSSTVLQGITQIWSSGDYPVATIIFAASFLIPIAKLFILALLLLSIDYKKMLSPRKLTFLHVLIERIGRWSMIDVFVIMLMISLFNSRLVSVSPGPAAVYFCLVVNLTMVATGIIDPRLFWAAEKDEANADASVSAKI